MIIIIVIILYQVVYLSRIDEFPRSTVWNKIKFYEPSAKFKSNIITAVRKINQLIPVQPSLIHIL